jgi:DNA invertase Pin-like site-specific DNA recombinase
VKRAVGYARVSTKKQNVRSYQPRSIEEFCAKQGFTLEAVFFDEGVSGYCWVQHRPGGRQVLAALETVDAVVVDAEDRWCKDPKDPAANLLITNRVLVAHPSSPSNLLDAAVDTLRQMGWTVLRPGEKQ